MKTGRDLVDCFTQDIAAFLESVSETQTTAQHALQQLLTSNAGVFSQAAVIILAGAAESAGTRFLLALLRKNNLLERVLADPGAMSRREALAIARAANAANSPIAPQLERMLAMAIDQESSASNTLHIRRILDLIEVAPQLSRLPFMRTDLLAYSNPHVRSKAMLLIARQSRNSAWLASALLDADPRVRASAVEALSSLDPAEGRPLLICATKSRFSRVAANAAVGLHRIGDSLAIGTMVELAQHEDLDFRISAIWAMGEVLDPRFLPFLADRFPHCTGRERTNVLRSLTRIRNREASLQDRGAIEIKVVEAVIKPEGTRRLVCTLWSLEPAALTSVRATEFALWEGGAPVYHYSVSAPANPPMIVSGFVLPRFPRMGEPYSLATIDAMAGCLRHKRANDLWRIDRYALDHAGLPASGRLDKAATPYDMEAFGAAKCSRGFLVSDDLLKHLMSSPGPKEKAAADVLAAFERQNDAMNKFSGIRQMFLFFQPGCEPAPAFERRLELLVQLAREERVNLHGFVPDTAEDCAMFRELCLSSGSGSFTMAAVEEIPAAVENRYAALNRFEITYRLPPGSDGGLTGSAAVLSNLGCGRVNFSLRQEI